MATLLQQAPVSDTVTADQSAEYSNQLNMSGLSGLSSFVTTIPSAQLIVFPQGAVATTGALALGTYSVSGTVSDTNGDTGAWTFTLTVTGSATPGTVVTPTSAAEPTGLEIMVPFQIDPATGGVAVLSNFAQIIEQHIMTIIMTAQKERVMLPSYGCGLEGAVFSPINSVQLPLLADDIKKQLSTWEPSANVLSVTATNAASTPNVINIVVEFSVVPFNDVNTVTVSTGGTITQVVAS